MKNLNHVIDSYMNYREEDRITTDKARKVEFITTVRALDEIIPPESKILDCGAGMGVYSFYFSSKGHKVTALDITPRHIQYIQSKTEEYKDLQACLGDGRDLSLFEDNSFDVVLCMGPMYHLTDLEDRIKCLSECIRVLKKGGLLITAYINRHFVIPQMISRDKKFIDEKMIQQITKTGLLNHDDAFCFWTDSYYSTPEEMEALYKDFHIALTDHLGTDGMSIFLRDTVNHMSEEEFKIWCDYHYSVSGEKSILGISNHGLIIGRK